MGESADRADPEVVVPITFVDDEHGVVVNFGILTGREATQAEIDRLADALHRRAGPGLEITITAVRRQDYGHGAETVLHQVRARTNGGDLPELEAICREWAVTCAEDRRVEPIDL